MDKKEKREKAKEYFTEVIDSEICDHNLDLIISSLESMRATAHMTWEAAASFLRISKTKFYEILKAGKIKKVDRNLYCGKSITSYINNNKEHNAK